MANEFDELLDYLELELQKKKDLDLVKKVKKPTNNEELKNQAIQNKTSSTKIIKEKSQEKVTNNAFEEISHFNVDKKEEKKEFKSSQTKGFDVHKLEYLMKQRLIDESKKLDSYERPYISVSELCNCLRQAYYKRLKYPIDNEKQFNFPYLYLIQNVGNSVHETIQDIYNFTEVEKRVLSEKYKVKGRVDAILDSTLIELKTIDEDKFKHNHLPEHYQQALIYSYILNTEYSYKIDTISIVYILRNCKKVYPFNLEIDYKAAQNLISKSLVLLDCISKKIVMEPINSKPETCKWCMYKRYCQKDQSKMKKAFEEKEEAVFLL